MDSSEDLSSPKIDNPESNNHQIQDYLEVIDKRSLPVERGKAIDFANFILQYDPPRDLLVHLATAVQYIDDDQFQQSEDKMAEAAREVIAGKPYAAVAHKLHGSQYWMYGNMMARDRGLPPASKIFYTEGSRVTPKEDINASFIAEFKNDLPTRTPIVVFDDWIIGGTQIEEVIKKCKQVAPESAINVFVVASTEWARQKLAQEPNVKGHSLGLDIKPIRELLNSEDFDFLKNLYKSVNVVSFDDQYRSLGGHETMLIGPHRCPDNNADILNGSMYVNGDMTKRAPSFFPPSRVPYSKSQEDYFNFQHS